MIKNPHCTDCELHKTAKTVCVGGRYIGDSNKDGTVDLMVVGDVPRGDDNRKGIALVGSHGQLLQAELAKVGIRNYYATNMVKCGLPDKSDLKKEPIKACKKYLEAEIEQVKPKYIVTLGAPTSKELLKISKITEAHGKIVELPGRKGFPIYHPAICHVDPAKLPAFQHDMGRLQRSMTGKLRSGGILWSIVTEAKLERFLNEFYESPDFSFDVETTGLVPHDPTGEINSIQFAIRRGNRVKGWVLPLAMTSFRYWPNEKICWLKYRPKVRQMIMDLLFDIVKATEKRSCGQNAKFDNLWLRRKYGRGFKLHFDTMLASHTLDENEDHDLKSMSRNHLDVEEYDLSTKEKKGIGIHPIRFFRYGCKDAIYTLMLKDVFRERLRADPDMHRLFNHLVMPASRALEDIEMVGMTLDMKQRDVVRKDTIAKKNRVEQQLNKLAGRKLNWDSPPQVAALLYGDLKIKCTLYTDKGAPSTSEAAILELKGKHEIVDKLIEYRELAKFLSTYIDGWDERLFDGQLYVSFKISGTVTGRYSSSIHSIPRDGIIRNLVTAPPGWTFVQCDLATAEMRIAGNLSRDPELIKCFTQNVDVHWRTLLFVIAAGSAGDYVKPAIETAQKITGKKHRIGEALEVLLRAGHEKSIELWKGWKEARKRAKAINFGFLYGMYEKKFIETCRMKYGFTPTFDEAQESRSSYFRLYSGLKPWHDRQKKLCTLDGFVRTLSGRKRRLPGIHSTDWKVKSECERQAINSPVQGMIGDVKAMAMVEIHETVPHTHFRLVGEHHDALLGMVRNDVIDETLTQVREIMRRPKLFDRFKIDLAIPLEAELELGNWGAGTKWEPKHAA